MLHVVFKTGGVSVMRGTSGKNLCRYTTR
jgi:hypothetical protein